AGCFPVAALSGAWHRRSQAGRNVCATRDGRLANLVLLDGLGHRGAVRVAPDCDHLFLAESTLLQSFFSGGSHLPRYQCLGKTRHVTSSFHSIEARPFKTPPHTKNQGVWRFFLVLRGAVVS